MFRERRNRDQHEQSVSHDLIWFSLIFQLGHMTFLLLARQIIKRQRGEPGHAAGPGPDPVGTQQLINRWRGNRRGGDCCVTFLLCPFHILS